MRVIIASLGLLFFLSTTPCTWSEGVQCESNPSFADVAGVPIANLSVQIYKKIAVPKTQANTVFSPVSVALALALLEKGAAGETQTKLQRFLAPPQPGDVRRTYESLQVKLKSTTASVDETLTIANGLFYGQELTFKRDFLAEAQCLSTEVQKVNFQEKEAARQKINSWVAGKTQQKIPELLGRDAISESTQAVLTNAVYLKAAWDGGPFQLLPNPAPFYRYGRSNDQQQVRFFQKVAAFGYLEEETYSIIMIPYTEQKLALIVALPKRKDGIQEMEQKLTADRINPLLRQFTTRTIDVRLPRFTIRTPTKLTQTLRDIGLADVFSGSADFSRMSNQSVKFDDVIHEAYIKVNENGTEAAAATAVIANRSRPAPPPPGEPTQFIADHPFIFAIVHYSTGTMIFLGKVNEISESSTRFR